MQQGFLAVELLITLFVAAAFLAVGNQLYLSVIKDGGETQQQSRASAIAYEYLRRESATISAPCSTSTPIDNQSIPEAEGLSNVFVTVNVTCPQPSELPDLSQVLVTVSYGENSEVSHATYVHP